jgi:hypothetical protein
MSQLLESVPFHLHDFVPLEVLSVGIPLQRALRLFIAGLRKNRR